MGVHGPDTETQRVRHFTISEAVAQEFQNVQFAPGQTVEVWPTDQLGRGRPPNGRREPESRLRSAVYDAP